MIAREHAEPERFRGWIAERLGLNFDDTKLEFLAEVLNRRADKGGLGLSPYLDRLENPGAGAELEALVLELTVPETYFFRHIDQFHAFADIVDSAIQTDGVRARKLKVLSAGCASGEEPYSLAILARERGLDPARDIEVRAVDINPAMLAKAARGCYSPWALRETPADIRRRWFRSVGKDFVLEDSIRAAVTFQEVNLAREEQAGLWTPETYGVIFCRNVLMYFTPDSAQALVTRLTRSLVPGGHLFLGHAETLRGLSNDYHLCHTHDTFYYQRKGAGCSERRGSEDKLGGTSSGKAPFHAPFKPAKHPDTSAAPALVAESAWATTWLETIRQASERIQALAERPSVGSTAGFVAGSMAGSATGVAARDAQSSNGRGQVAVQLQLVLELLKKERFSDALDLLAGLPAGSEQDPDVLLLRAALLTHSGQLDAAERASAQLLDRDELNTGAHYLLALCRESAGDPRGAVDHDRVAVYLDPGFAMPRLHLGLMARRAGDPEGARRELGQALLLLKREDASRLLLFGGGFGRDALVALCRTELLSAGGLP